MEAPHGKLYKVTIMLPYGARCPDIRHSLTADASPSQPFFALFIL